MYIQTLLFLLPLLLQITISSSILDTLTQGSSLSVEKSTKDVLSSRNGVFSAGFFPVGENAYAFAIWIIKASPPTVVWMANRDQPVNGVASKLTLLKNGDLILKDGAHRILWETNTLSSSLVKLQLQNNGNLVVLDRMGVSLWESFNTPTDSLLPQQMLTKNIYLISSKSKTNYSSGNYKLSFENSNVLSLFYNVPETTSIYWPPPWKLPSKSGRLTYNSSRVAVLDGLGQFTSTDDIVASSADYGKEVLRRLTLDTDGNLRLYSLDERRKSWIVSWQAISQPCFVHGVCGLNAICSYDPVYGRRCSCLPGYIEKDPADWSKGCEPEFNLSCNSSTIGFLKLHRTDFYGNDKGGLVNAVYGDCLKICLNMCSCKGFKFFRTPEDGNLCFLKTTLLNGYTSPFELGHMNLKYPKSLVENPTKKLGLVCSNDEASQVLNRTYEKARENQSLKLLLWFAISIAGLETTCILLVWFFLFRTDRNNKVEPHEYAYAARGFTKFTYTQLKLATRSFSEEIGRGGGGVVYKGMLPDQRIAAIKRLNGANQGEDEFLAEASIIGRLNHMNLIQMWGYCAEGKHRLLVYEYIEHGSLADNLTYNALNWEKRFDIALGTAKGLSYLHEECLEWIFHCDIKPQNILLDSDYQPKVADFGLSKLLNRSGPNNLQFSRIRGTRGYMAPEWVYNLPINSKVDVYSYGIVVLELVSGKSPNGFHSVNNEGVIREHEKLFPWVREMMNEGATGNESWVIEIVDPLLGSEYNVDQMERLVTVALKCVEEDKDLRPTMSQVVEMLQSNNDDYFNNFSNDQH